MMSMNLEREKEVLPVSGQADTKRNVTISKILFGGSVVSMLVSLYFIFIFAEDRKNDGSCTKNLLFPCKLCMAGIHGIFCNICL